MPDPLLLLFLLGLFLLAALVTLHPQRGLLLRWRRGRVQDERIRIEDALKHIHGCEMSGDRFTVQSLAGVLQISVDEATELLLEMERRNLLRVEPDGLRLTPVGRRSALHILRAHRLWERYLADQTGYGELDWHGQAEDREHHLTPQEADNLAAQLGNPTHDPHGDPIPTPEGDLVPHGGMPLISADLDTPLLIVHMEDEPTALYAQLVAEGLRPGMELRLIENSPERVRFWSGEDEHVLAPIVAANISVLQHAEETAPKHDSALVLSQLRGGQRGRVLAISPKCRGLERRRLQDLGVLPGTEVRAEFVSPGGDPTAYRIREAVIALRKEQADLILIDRLEGPA